MNKALIRKAVTKMAETMTKEDTLEIAEVSDFGDSIGFAFETKNKYQNVYWCINKKTMRVHTFQPNTNPGKYSNRKIITAEFE